MSVAVTVMMVHVEEGLKQDLSGVPLVSHATQLNINCSLVCWAQHDWPSVTVQQLWD